MNASLDAISTASFRDKCMKRLEKNFSLLQNSNQGFMLLEALIKKIEQVQRMMVEPVHNHRKYLGGS